MNFPEDLKYTKEHEWLRVEGNIGTVGVTDNAQGELGDIVYIDISSSLQEVSEGETFGTIEAVKTVADLYAPVSGKIVEVGGDDLLIVAEDDFTEHGSYASTLRPKTMVSPKTTRSPNLRLRRVLVSR